MTIRELFVTLGFKVDESSTRQAEKAIDGVKDETKDLGSSMDDLTGLAKSAFGAIATIFSVSAVKNFASECIGMASDVEQMSQKFDVVFGDLSEEADSWAENFANTANRNKNTIKTYLADSQNLLYGFAASYVDLGQMTEEEARSWGAGMSEEMTSLALDIASFANMDEDTAVNAMTKAVMGETESAKTLGAVLSDTTRELAMQTLGMEGSYDSLDQLQKMQVNYQAILSQSADAVGDLSRSSDSYESQQRGLTANLEYMKEYIGGQLLPVYQVMTQWLSRGVSILTKLAKAILETKDGANRLELGMQKVSDTYEQLKPIITAVTDGFKKGMKAMKEALAPIVEKMGGADAIITDVEVAVASLGSALVVANLAKGFTLVAQALKLIKVPPQLLLIAGIIAAIILVVQDLITFMNGGNSVIGGLLKKNGKDIGFAQAKVQAFINKIKKFCSDIPQYVGAVVDKVKQAWEKIGPVIIPVVTGIFNLVKSVLIGLKNGWDKYGSSIFDSIVQIVSNVISIVKSVIDALQPIFDIIMSIVGSILGLDSEATGIGPVILGLINALLYGLSFMTGLIAKIVPILKPIIKTVVSVITTIIKFIGKVISTVVKIVSVVAPVIAKIAGFILMLINPIARIIAIIAVIKNKFGSLKEFLSAVLNAIAGFFLGIWNGIVSTVSSLVSGFVSGIVGFFTGLWNMICSIGNGIASFFTGLWSGIVNFAVGAWTGFVSFIVGIWSGIVGFFSSIGEGISNTVTSIIETVSGMIDDIVTFFTDLPGKALEWGKDMIQGFVDGILNVKDKIVDTVSGVADSVKEFLHFSKPDKGPLRNYQDWMPDMMNGLAKGISDYKSKVVGQVQDMATDIQMLVNGATASTATAGTSMVSNTTSSVTQNVNISNAYNGSVSGVEKAIPSTMKKSSNDATTQMARALAFSRG